MTGVHRGASQDVPLFVSFSGRCGARRAALWSSGGAAWCLQGCTLHCLHKAARPALLSLRSSTRRTVAVVKGAPNFRNNSVRKAPGGLCVWHKYEAERLASVLLPLAATLAKKTSQKTLGDGWRQVEGQSERSAQASHIHLTAFGRRPWLRKLP